MKGVFMTDLLTIKIRNAFIKTTARDMSEADAIKAWDQWLEIHQWQPLPEKPMPAPTGFTITVD